MGLARQGSALARFFAARGDQVIITDQRLAAALQSEIAALQDQHTPIEFVLGEHPLTLLDGCDLLCLSGGVPPETPLPQEARRRGIALSNDSLLTRRLAAAPMIGITGSSGKTTTTTLVGEMLQASGYTTWVGGNIGTPLIDRLEQIAADHKMVLELSSFQLQLFSEPPSVSPTISAILNITPNHLDRHPSMAHYAAAKANILRFQTAADVAVLGTDDPITGQWQQNRQVDIAADLSQEAVCFDIQARLVGFSLNRQVERGAFLRRERLTWRWDDHEADICAANELQLPGRHNVANILAACAISGAAGAHPEAMRQVAVTFAGVAHRLELVRQQQGVRWYNDSIATTPERLAAALRSFDPPLILLAGGRDKHLPWQDAATLIVQRVRHLIVFGEAADLIAQATCTAMAQAQPPDKPPALIIHRCTDLAQAVELAARVAQPGDRVLLSPGGTSFDAYRDFEQRGDHFRSLVWALK